MLEQILYPALIIGVIGLLFGAILAFASIVFKVEKDERIDIISEILPGANCGGCGYAGCSGLAQAIVEDGVEISRCNLITNDKATEIGNIMGVEVDKITAKKAVITCKGTCDSRSYKCEIFGIDDCYSAAQLGTGPKSCEYGCMGLGSCVKVCSENAISIVDGIAFIDDEKCIGCGKCAKICPKNVIQIIPEKKTAIVKCVSKDKGATLKNYCTSGCIACKICEKKCPKEAITVSENLAKINYDLCVGCGICESACPKGVIEMFGAKPVVNN